MGEIIAKGVFYMLSTVLSFDWAWLILLIGARRRGKTFSCKKWLLNRFKYHGEKFIILRYTDEECQTLAKDNGLRFWGDVQSKVKKFADLKIEMTTSTITIDGVVAGYVMPVRLFHKFKGSQYEDVKNILFDEFIPEDTSRYSGDQVSQFLNALMSVVSFRKDFKIILTANALDSGNPLLNDILHIRLKSGEFGLYKRRDKGAIVHYIPNSEEFIEYQKQGNIYQLIKGTRYEDNLLNNKFKGDSDSSMFYTKRKACDLYGIYYNRDKIAVRIYQAKSGDIWYAGKDINPNTVNYMRYTFIMSQADNRIRYAPPDEKKMLQQLYANNLILFENEYILKLFKEIIA